MSELKPCPFCGGEAFVNDDPTGNGGKPHMSGNVGLGRLWSVECDECGADAGFWQDRDVAIAAWNSRAAMEFDNWFYLPKPKEPIVEVTETTHAWDGTKVKTDVFYQVQEQAVINWAKELDEHIIKRICEVWNSRAERTCHKVIPDEMEGYVFCSECGAEIGEYGYPNYCPNCGAKVLRNTPKCSETTTKVVGE